MLKRTFDIFLALCGLIISLPLLIIIALAIKTEDGGPVLFRQVRVGRYGKKFTILKFRSMSIAKHLPFNGFEPGNKSRITKTGKIIRKTKLDELPQLFNVLKGEMSFVGPRPEVEYWVSKFPERWKYVHQVRPGITDSASIEFRNEEDLLAKSPDPVAVYEQTILPRKLSLYEDYIRNVSLTGDIKIVIKTIFSLINRKFKSR
jgi:lipopolysaccharide/colanic/teichoic acid biosynthesis glycosyltransferase